MSTHFAENMGIPESKVHTLEEGFRAFSSGDIERILALAHADFEATVPPELSTEPDTYRGHDGVRRYFETFAEAFEDIRFEPEQFWDPGGELLVASVRMTAKGKQTSIPVEQRNAQVWRIKDGRLRSVMTYASLSDALEDAGLDPRSAQPPA
jgi:ketosteroid isomerase-like protein